jgi:hypothetical protein
MEEQGSAGGAERQIAKLVEDDEIRVGEPGGDLSGFALKLLLFKSVDQFGGGEETTSLIALIGDFFPSASLKGKSLSKANMKLFGGRRTRAKTRSRRTDKSA